MKASGFVAFLVFGLLSTAAHAEWLPVAESRNGTIWFVDPERIRVVGGKIQVWAKLDHSRDGSVKWRESKHLVSINCADNTSLLLSYINYDSYGKIGSSNSFPDYGSGYDPIVPDSVMEAVAKVACIVAPR